MRAILFHLILLTSILRAGTTREVTCRLIKMEAGGELTSVLVASENGGEILSPLPSDSLSAKVICPVTNNSIPFLSGSDRIPVATARIPASMRSALLIFFQTKAAAGAPEAEEAEEPVWEILVTDDFGRNDAKGGGLVANCTLAEIRYTIGSEEEIIPPLETRFFMTPKDRDNFNMAPVKLESLTGDRWKLTNENSLRFLPGVRYLIFSFPDYPSGRPRVNIVQDPK